MTAIGHHMAGGDTATIRIPHPRVRPWVAVVGSISWTLFLGRLVWMAFGG